VNTPKGAQNVFHRTSFIQTATNRARPDLASQPFAELVFPAIAFQCPNRKNALNSEKNHQHDRYGNGLWRSAVPALTG
jgi:hypothetical protein